jgi:transposase InsO family protein
MDDMGDPKPGYNLFYHYSGNGSCFHVCHSEGFCPFREIVRDHKYISRLFQEMCQMLGTTKTRTTPYHPKSDGMVERFNRTLETMLSAYVSDNKMLNGPLQNDVNFGLHPFFF